MKRTKAASAAEEPKHTNPSANQTAEDQVDWGAEEGATGFEGTRPEDLGIPFLVLLQKGSPEVDEDHPDHETRRIEDAKAGMIINSLTREIVYNGDEDQPLIVIPMFHQRLWQEWKTRDQGGGFIASHNSPVILTRCKRDEKNRDILPNGNEIKTTSYFSCLQLINGQTDLENEDESQRPVRCILAMTSTQLKKATQWLNMMRTIKINGRTPPMYSHLYRVTTVPESNEKGNWKGFKVEIDRTLTMADVGIVHEGKKIAGEMANNTRLLNAPPADEPTEREEDNVAGM